MPTLGAFVEVLVVAAVEHVETVQHVLRCVGVDNVEEDSDAHAVGGIDKLFQFIWKAVTTASGKEAVYLVAETGIVGVLHNGHELDDVVAEILDSGQDVCSELFVRCDLGIRGGDADVCFVDSSAEWLWWSRVLEDVALVLGRIPEAGIVDGRYVEVLGDSCDPSGDTLLSCVIVRDNKGDLGGSVGFAEDMEIESRRELSVRKRRRSEQIKEIPLFWNREEWQAGHQLVEEQSQTRQSRSSSSHESRDSSC